MADERADKLLRKSFQEIQHLRAALQEAKSASTEPIAIVGMACRVPGGVVDPEGYWSLLDEGRDAIRPFPARWEPESIYDPDPDAAGKSYVREAGYLDDVELFDADFFGIAPREAVQMDPQQRITLEVCWEALERAGIVPQALSNTRTGVYVGAMGCDYGLRNYSLKGFDGYRITGSLGGCISGRVSYCLGLIGPSMTIDTACSSSLVALHLACASLRRGECDQALSGGVTVMSTPGLFVEFSRLQGSAPDGRCKAFGASADGAGWSEGCGMLVLKRLRDAKRDGDSVLAVIRGTAVNQDGRSQGLTVPNGPSQQRVIRDALKAAELTPADIDAIEAHGTGTSLGDPIEAGALGHIFGPSRSPERPVWLGSSKSNIGHGQAAAGVLGVIKMVLALRQERLPRTLHAESPSPHIDWKGSGLALLQRKQPWPRSDERLRRAGISSFGISGTNAHLVLEEAPAADVAAAGETRLPLPLLVSGRDEGALRAQARRWGEWLKEHSEADWADVATAAATGRTHFDVRASISARSRPEALEALGAVAAGKPHSLVTTGSAAARSGPVFVFSGHGSQWLGMGEALLRESSVFRAAIEDCQNALEAHIDWDLRDVLTGRRPALLDRVDVLQPAIFAMGVGLAEVWRSLGVEPAAVVGHSVGEIAAAVVCGALSLGDAAKIAAVRGRLIAAVEREGAMLHVPRCEEEVVGRIERWLGRLSVAVVNDANTSVVSGDASAIEELQRELETRGIEARRVQIGFAAHCFHMDEVLEPFRAQIADVRPEPSRVPFFSTVVGEQLDGGRLTADYWCRNVRDVVRFGRTVARIVERGYDVFLESGAHPVLAMPLSSACAEARGVVAGSLARGAGGMRAILTNLGALHTAGLPVDWSEVAGESAARTSLPTYAFQRRSYWQQSSRSTEDFASLGLVATGHPLLGVMAPVARGEQFLFSGRLCTREQLWLADHGAMGVPLFPAAGVLDLVLRAGKEIGSATVTELALERPLALRDDTSVQVQLHVDTPDSEGGRAFELFSRAGGAEAQWTRHATGRLCDALASPWRRDVAWPPSGATAVDVTELHDHLAAQGYEYGPAFRGLDCVYERGETVYARAKATPEVAAHGASYVAHPALLDAALHALLAGAVESRDDSLWLPVSWSDVTSREEGASELRVEFELIRDRSGEEHRTFAMSAVAGDGRPVLEASLRLQRVTHAHLRAMLSTSSRDMYVVDWLPLEQRTSCAEDGDVRFVGANRGLADALGVCCSNTVQELVEDLAAGVIPEPSTVVLDATPDTTRQQGSVARSGRRAAERALTDLQTLLAEPRLTKAGFVWLAETVDGAESLAGAPIKGLLRSARNENPDRVLRWVDVDRVSPGSKVIRDAIAAHGEPELRVRDEVMLAPALIRTSSRVSAGASLDPNTTILITGGMGELGRLAATHLVRAHGARHLLLTSRRGPNVPETKEVIASLREAGAESVQVVACDVSDREELAAVLESAEGGRPLGAVFHLAGVLEDGLVTHVTANTLHRVLRPKVDGAWNLHELTADKTLSHFVLFSSIAGVMGTLGQAAYAAANTFLDELAERRRQQGLAGLSLAWGLWERQGSGLTADLSTVDLTRVRRQGIAPLSVQAALALLDEALDRPEPALVPVRLDLPALVRELPVDAELPPLLRRLSRARARRGGGVDPKSRADFRARVAAMPEGQRGHAVLAMVREQIAAVLQLAGPFAVQADEPLRDIGLDSLMSVELRNRLSREVGESLPTTLAFDHPTPAAIARFLLQKMPSEPATPTARWDDDAIHRKLRSVSIEALRSSGMLEALMAQPDASPSTADSADAADTEAILEAEDESLLDVAQRLLG